MKQPQAYLFCTHPRSCDCLQVGNNGGIEGLIVDTAGRYISSSYAQRISLHEAGHFLIAYLIGLLPKVYTLSTLDAVQRSVAKEAVIYDLFAVCSIFAVRAACTAMSVAMTNSLSLRIRQAWKLYSVLSN